MPEHMASGSIPLLHSQRRAYFGPSHGWTETSVITREELPLELRPGPLIIEEYDATTVVPPGAAARRDRWGDILIATNGTGKIPI